MAWSSSRSKEQPTVFALAYSFAAQAAAQSVIEDVRWGAAINHAAIVDRLREGGFERATIGICDSLPHDMWLNLREALPEAKLEARETRSTGSNVRGAPLPERRGARVVSEGGEVLRPRVRGRRRRGPPRDEGVRARRGDPRHLPPPRRITLRSRDRREPHGQPVGALLVVGRWRLYPRAPERRPDPHRDHGNVLRLPRPAHPADRAWRAASGATKDGRPRHPALPRRAEGREGRQHPERRL